MPQWNITFFVPAVWRMADGWPPWYLSWAPTLYSVVPVLTPPSDRPRIIFSSDSRRFVVLFFLLSTAALIIFYMFVLRCFVLTVFTTVPTTFNYIEYFADGRNWCAFEYLIHAVMRVVSSTVMRCSCRGTAKILRYNSHYERSDSSNRLSA